MEIWEVKVNEFIDKLKDLFPRRWNTRSIRTLVEGVQNNVCRAILLEGEHFFQAFYHGAITRRPYSTIVYRI
jgi:hypothetical protein